MQKGTVITLILSIGLVLTTGFGIGMLANNTASAESSTNYMNFSQQNTGIWVSGQGKVTVTPDIAVISAGVEVRADLLNEAQTQAAQAMAALLETVKAAGVNERDITTQQYYIQPVYTWDEQSRNSIITGYRVTNTVTIKVRLVESAGSIIDDITRITGSYTRINNVYFTVDNPEQYYEQARENAMADAKSKAEQMAALSGIQLGKPTYISEGSSYYPPVVRYDGYYGAKEDAQAPATPIAPGETDIVLGVQVVYSIQQ